MAAVIFSGTKVKALKGNLDLFGVAQVLTGTADPRFTATDAKKGSLYLQQGTLGQVFKKDDDGSSTNWSLISTGIFAIAQEIKESIRNHLDSSEYEAVTPIVFMEDLDTFINGSSTGALNSNAGTFDFSAGSQTFVSEDLLDDKFLASSQDVSKVDLHVYWDSEDTAATYEVSRNGGLNWQTVTPMEELDYTGLYVGKHIFADTETQSNVFDNSVGGPGNLEFNTTTIAYAQPFTLASAQVINGVDIYMNKTGSPAGYMHVSIKSELAGEPDELLSEALVLINDITTFPYSINLPSVALAPSNYFVELRVDSAYVASYSGSTKIVSARNDNDGVLAEVSGVWTDPGIEGLRVLVKGRPLDLRVRITSSAGSKSIDGIGVFYENKDFPVANGIKRIDRQSFLSVTDNYDTFTLPFIPDIDLLTVHVQGTGQVYTYGDFQVDGYDIVFPPNTFNSVYGVGVDGTVTLVFKQNEGTSFDNSDQNANNIATLQRQNQNGVLSTSADYLISDLDGYGVIIVNTGGGNRTVTLPTAADNIGRRLVIKKNHALNTLIVDGEGSETIDGALTNELYAVDAYVELVCDGSGWRVLGAYDYVEAVATADSTTSATDTEIDVTGMNISLSPGSWIMGYDLALRLARVSGTTTYYASTRITDGSNNAMSRTDAVVSLPASTTVTELWHSISRSRHLSIISANTYKVRVRASGNNTACTATVHAENITAGLATPENSSNIWARRIK